jgi:hypothetical protein
MESNKKVYISYSQKDSLFVEVLTSRLAESGINIWYDKSEINPGENWQERINEGIKNAKVLLFIISKDSIKSVWTAYEAKKFISQGRKVIPLIKDDVEEIPAFISQIQYIDFRNNFEYGFDLLMNALVKENIPKSFNVAKPIQKNKGYVFLSYCNEDSDFTSELKDFLKTNSYGFWDYKVSKIDYHRHLFFELEDKIINAVATLSILSEFWKQSKWSLKEYFFSEEVGTPIILLKAKTIPPTLVISGLPFIDFTIDKLDGFEKLKGELQRKKL